MTLSMVVSFAVLSTLLIVALLAEQALTAKVRRMSQRIDMFESRFQALSRSHFDLEQEFYDYTHGSGDDDYDHQDHDGDDGDDDEYRDPFDDDPDDLSDAPLLVSLLAPALGSV